jgi:TolB-like protein
MMQLRHEEMMDLQFGDFRLKRRERQILGPGGPLELSARAYDILVVLLSKPDQPVGKDEIFEAVWPGVAVEENTLQVHVSALRKALGPSLIVTVHGRGYKYAGPAPIGTGSKPPPQSAMIDRKPVIAVLPFANLSGDPEQQYFSDGITEDIITRLSKYRILAVIGTHSSFAMRGRDDDLAELRDKLSADYALTGSIRKSGLRVRISARLTATGSGNAVWAESYDRPLHDIFDVQDEVAALIASTLMGRVEVEAGMHRSDERRDLTSYELVLRGIWHFKNFTADGNEKAAELFREALAINPANAEALRWLSSYHIVRWLMVHDSLHLKQSVDLGRRAAELDPLSAMCHTAHGFATLWADGCGSAAAIYARALRANPGDPDVLAELALLSIYGGDLEQADEFLAQAEKLNPLPPLSYAEFRGIADFARGRYAEALPGFVPMPECGFNAAYVMACFGHLEDRAGIAAVLPRVKAQNWNLLAVAADEPFRNPEPRQRLIDGVTKALALAKT